MTSIMMTRYSRCLKISLGTNMRLNGHLITFLIASMGQNIGTKNSETLPTKWINISFWQSNQKTLNNLKVRDLMPPDFQRKQNCNTSSTNITTKLPKPSLNEKLSNCKVVISPQKMIR